MAAPRLRLLPVATALCLATALGACGPGGGGLGDPGPLAIVTAALPVAGVATPYDVLVEATGGSGDYSWTLLPGSTLPPGMSFETDGSLEGTPTELGAYDVVVEVSDVLDPASRDSASYTLTVSEFAVFVSLLRFGDAWSSERYPVSTVGGAGSVSFELAVNASGGALVDVDPSLGTATYVPGGTTGLDRIRAENASGDVSEIEVQVHPDPVASMVARFSSTDVWHVRFSGKRDGGHPEPSDFDAALVAVGLRSPASGDSVGSIADQLARACVQREVLRHLNGFYRNEPDGDPAPGGLEISFPFEQPPPPQYSSPGDGRIARPEPYQFNVISVLAGDSNGVIGTAYLDDGENSAQENDTTASGTGSLGVFCDEIAYYFNAAYSNSTLRSAPVGAGDVPALKSLLYGEPSAGGRADEIRRVVVGFARTLAATTAHEIGHSLGLRHTSPSQSGSIMNAAAVIAPSATYSFTSSDLTTLASALPGPGRGGTPLVISQGSATDSEPSGIPTAVVCGCCETHAGD